MNLPKTLRRQAELDLRLQRTLVHWAEQQIPPVRVRQELMRSVRLEAASQGRHVLRQPSDGFIESVNLGPVITFNHCFSVFYSLQARVRL